MHLSLIQEGEELEKRASKGWKEMRLESGNSAIYCYLEGRGVEEYSLTAGVNGHEIPKDDARLIVYMRTHAKELLEAAKELALLKQKYPKYAFKPGGEVVKIDE